MDIAVPNDRLADAADRAIAALCAYQRDDGHFVFELEADATIPAEYVLLEHFLDRIDPALEAKIGVYLRSIQGAHGGWPLFHDGALNLSASVKAYFALKMIGDSPEAEHMRLAREAILAHGGAGHNFYMLHGGSNFETWNDDSGAASYDYGAAIGQCGDRRPGAEV